MATTSSTLQATEIPSAIQALQTKPAFVVRRDGTLSDFNPERIRTAMLNAFLADQGITGHELAEHSLNKILTPLTDEVVSQLCATTEHPTVEHIQDLVERTLMERGHYSVARRYIVYREEHARARNLRLAVSLPETTILPKEINWDELGTVLEHACAGLPEANPSQLFEELAKNIYPGIPHHEVERALLLIARAKIERYPIYSQVASRILLFSLYREVFGLSLSFSDANLFHRTAFQNYLEHGVKHERLDPALLEFKADVLSSGFDTQRDDLFQFMGLQTLADRYLLHDRTRRFETPQFFWMRVAMGLAMRESRREEKALEFYHMLSTMRFVSSTPTLFNAGTLRPQLSSCFLTTVPDDLQSIFKSISDNARLSKWAGGLGNDWTPVRALGAAIHGTNGESQGVIPFLKVVNAAAVAVNQGGKRQGAVCAYLETWHLDIEEFLDLRKNSGDERRRTHDINTANWIPDLFMKRVRENGLWSLFSPDEVPDLHDLYGSRFEQAYVAYETKGLAGEIKKFKQVPARELWRKMISVLFETGHPWMTFKDPCNLRSPQDHVGVVHSSNLCTEITLNTSASETAVCNLGSLNLSAHLQNGQLNLTLLEETIQTAVQMLDNVIDINFYPTPEAAQSNQQHRPIGLGLMGFQDCLYEMGISYASDGAVQFADESMEFISHTAILASTKLAAERGAYASFSGSKWDRGILPIDSIALLEAERGESIKMTRSAKLDWSIVRDAIKQHGLRNSNILAIAPTATIANIAGVSASIEPTYRNLYVKSNLSGDFVTVNPHLIADLRKLNLWDDDMLALMKYHDGSIQSIEEIPLHLREKYRTAFEIEPRWLIACASARQKWIDQAQSLNLYVVSPSGPMLSDMYFLAWESGLKTTYYLRSQAATQIEKSTLDINRFGIQPRWMKNRSASSEVEATAKQCSIDDPGCEACQ